MVSSECVPFAKSGGLGDVVGALPKFLKKLGHDPIVVIPKYSFIDIAKHEIDVAIEKMNVQMGTEISACSVYKISLPDNVSVYFIDYEPYFGRPNIYHDNYFNDYHDNPKTLCFFIQSSTPIMS